MIDTMEICRKYRMGLIDLNPTPLLSKEPTPSEILLERFARNSSVQKISSHWYRFDQNCYVWLSADTSSTVKVKAVWVEPEYRRIGLGMRLLDLLKHYCDGVAGSRILLFPVPFFFTVPISKVANLECPQSYEFEEELDGPLYPTPSPNWRELRQFYLRAGFIEQKYSRIPMSEYGKRIGRLPLTYESRKNNESN